MGLFRNLTKNLPKFLQKQTIKSKTDSNFCYYFKDIQEAEIKNIGGRKASFNDLLITNQRRKFFFYTNCELQDNTLIIRITLESKLQQIIINFLGEIEGLNINFVSYDYEGRIFYTNYPSILKEGEYSKYKKVLEKKLNKLSFIEKIENTKDNRQLIHLKNNNKLEYNYNIHVNNNEMILAGNNMEIILYDKITNKIKVGKRI